MTDNQVFEGCFYKVYSNSRKLNELVLRLILVEMGTGCILHVTHLEGTRMKIAGIYVLYPGYLLGVMMTGQNPLEFIPLNKSADERSGGQVVSCINTWWKDRTRAAWGGNALKRLSLDGWFDMHTQDMTRLFTPPPEAMETVAGVFNEDCLE